MGARPLFFTVSLAVPAGISERWILDFYDGLTEPGSSGGAQLIGGDLSHSEEGIFISITALGESINRKVLYRSGGRAGDLLYVTGTLGRSAAGLKLLQNGCIRPRSRSQKEAIRVASEPGTALRSRNVAGSVRLGPLHDGSERRSFHGSSSHVYGKRSRRRDPCSPTFRFFRNPVCGTAILSNWLFMAARILSCSFRCRAPKAGFLEETIPPILPRITRIGTMTQDSGKIWMIEPGKNRRLLVDRGYDHFPLLRKKTEAKLNLEAFAALTSHPLNPSPCKKRFNLNNLMIPQHLK